MTESQLTLLPWQHAIWDSLAERIVTERLPHALLFAGPAGVGKRHLAFLLAASLLCEQPQPGAKRCGHCRGCHLFSAGNHPDYLYLQPEEGKRSIGVDAVRELAAFLSLKSHAGNRKVVIVDPADVMTPSAANALLKTLEEPTPGSYLLLCSDQPASLLATIRSRCQMVPVTQVSPASALPWLEQQLAGGADAKLLLALSGGLPLKALVLAAEGRLATRSAVFTALAELSEGGGQPITTAAQWHSLGTAECLHWLQLALQDMARFKGGFTESLHNPDQVELLRCLAERLDLVSLHRYLEKVQHALVQSRGQANSQLLLEELLAGWPRAAQIETQGSMRKQER